MVVCYYILIKSGY